MASIPNIYDQRNKGVCVEAVRLLCQEKVIALDSKGVQLGQVGPLTLLQIGTLDGRVFIFDVMKNERDQDKTFFQETGLDKLLSSPEIVKVSIVRKNTKFWTKRPLTQEMIDYLTRDVTVLLPEVHQQSEQIKEESRYRNNPDYKKCYKERLNARRKEILKYMAQNYRSDTRLIEIVNEDERRAIVETTLNEISNTSYPQMIRNLKLESLDEFLMSLKIEIADQQRFIPTVSKYVTLDDVIKGGTDEMETEGKEMKKKFEHIVTNGIDQKYNVGTPLCFLSSIELRVLRRLQPLNKDNEYTKTVNDLYWNVVEKDLDEQLAKPEPDPEYMEWNSLRLTRYVNDTHVPDNIKSKAFKLKSNERVMIDALSTKYTLKTSTDELSEAEKVVLDKLDVKNGVYDPVVEYLHWEVTYTNLSKDHEEFTAGILKKNDIKRKLKFLSTYEKVPDKIKQKAKLFQRDLMR